MDLRLQMGSLKIKHPAFLDCAIKDLAPPIGNADINQLIFSGIFNIFGKNTVVPIDRD